MNIAVLFHDRTLAGKVLRALASKGYACQAFRTRERFFDALKGEVFDVLLLEAEERAGASAELVREAKAAGTRRVLLVASAAFAESVRMALDAGADDYLCLPLRGGELQMRAGIMARQLFPEDVSHIHLRYGDFVFARHPNELRFAGKPVKLAAREFDLALFFFSNMGVPLSRAHIADAIWKMDGNDMARTIDTHVSRVRNRLNLKPENGFLLEQVYGFGYRLVALDQK